MNPLAATPETLEELAYREGNGVAVSLIWNRATNGLRVAASDRATGEAFALDVEATEALEVFHHPFAYAASRRPAADALEPAA
jgi:hypothetical protein